MNEPFLRHRGTMMPLRRSNVDTDQIIPASYLQRIERTGFEEGLFARWREDPAFVLNDPRFASATVLVAGQDFGTGSSREHAVWALQQWGFAVVLSSRFGDIFRGNATNAGLLTAIVDGAQIEALQDLADRHPDAVIEVDLDARSIRSDGIEHDIPFEIGDAARGALLRGDDAIGSTLAFEDEIAAYEARRSPFAPSVEAAR
jgi:3-isopropylmalate/(R)-2-methylmalate dehydratase small subunit